MDINELENFLNYEPVFDTDPVFILDEIKEKASKHLPKAQLKWIDKAYQVAKAAHEWQQRISWEPYFIHPLKATLFLMKIRPDLKTIQTCILHDVIEDTDYSYEYIKEVFGKEVADLCISLEKVSKVRYEWQDRNLETLKKTFLAMWKDLRVIFVKIADRIHNIQTLKFHPKEEKKKRIAKETLKIYVPISQRLGLHVFQNYLENWSFYILNNKSFNRIFTHIKKKHWKQNHFYVDEWIKKIEEVLNNSNIEYDSIKWRIKSPYRINKKLKKYWTDDPNKIMDILAFRIITKSVADCYSALWAINNKYTPLIKKIKDYIALPKANWYRSLHTTVIWMFSFPVEIQIRDQEMDHFAEFWVAAHFAYKEKWAWVKISQKQAKWIQKLQEIVNNFQTTEKNEDFQNTLQIEALDKNIFVYTPNGDVMEMPPGSTVLDFAFKVHSEVWLKFKAAFVDDKIVPIDYKLKTWSIINIKTYKKKYSASANWIDFLHNPSSKSKLNKFIRQNQLQQHIQEAQNMVNEKLKYYSLPALWDKQDLIKKNNSQENLENLLLRVHDKQISPTKLIKKYYPKIDSEEKHRQKQIENEKAKEENITKTEDKQPTYITWKVIVDWYENLNYYFCPECKPKHPDKIIWKSTRDWIKIHCIKCKAIESISYEKLISTYWDKETNNLYNIHMKIKIRDKPWALIQILSVFSDFSINISNINVNTKQEWKTIINVDLDISNPSKMQFVLKELKNKNELIRIIEKNIM